LLDEHAPLITKKVTIKSRPKWYNATILAAKQERRKAEREWRKTKLLIHHDIFKTKQQTVNKLCEKAKSNFFCNKIHDTKGNQKKLFQITNELLHRKKVSVLPTHCNPTELCEKFADFFGNKIEKIRKQLKSLVSRDSAIPADQPCDIASIPRLNQFTPISEDDLKKLICSSNSKTCAADPIPTTLLKASLDTLLPILCKVVNLSFHSNTMPASLKSAIVTPLLKKSNMDSEDMKSYRPVSNLPYLSKLVEKVAVRQMNDHMSEHNLHEPHQSAYRQNHSTETALIKSYNDLL
jgi:hypothetical protein